MSWFFFAFMTAIFEALKDVASKRSLVHVSEYAVAWSWMVFALPLLVPAVLVQPVPLPQLTPTFWVALLAGSLCNTLAITLYVKAIKASDLSITVPMIAFTPLFLLVTSPLIVGEFPDALGVIGVLLIVGGSYVLNLKERNKGYLEPYRALLREPGPKLMLLVAFIWSIGANIDKVGVQNSAPFFWALCMCASIATLMAPVILWSSERRQQIRNHIGALMIIGLLSALVALFQMTAITMTLVAFVIAVKRTSTVMSVFLGYLVFQEGQLQERLTGAAIMILGVVCITVL